MQQTERVGTLQHPTVAPGVQEVIDQDLITTCLFTSLARAFCRLAVSHDMVPNPVRGAASRVIGEIDAMDKKIGANCPGVYIKVNNDTMMDAAALIELISEIGNDHDKQEYADMLNLITNSIQSIVYAQRNGKKLHVGKYKALTRLIADEIKRDTNREPSMVLFRKTPQCPNGELFIRASTPDCKPEIH